MLWIISGPSSAGKSTFLASPRCEELTGLPAGTPILWPGSHAQLDPLDSADAFVHYNILRPLQQFRRRDLKRMDAAQGDTLAALSFRNDAPWAQLVNHGQGKRAIVLIASKESIVRRMTTRRVIERSGIKGEKENPYPAERMLSRVHLLDFDALYRSWLQELREHDIPYILVDSENETFREIDEAECEFAKGDRTVAPEGNRAFAELGEVATSNGERRDESGYTRERILQILESRKFAYHRVDLPFGLHTGGDDRSQTRDLIFPASLSGKSVLDVGCALGYFCFEAEARGAARVVGVDILEDRLRDAAILKDIKQSKVAFVRRDVSVEPIDETFDYVLLLNVIHHLKEPFRVMRQLAAIAKERLIVEFPTFADARFRTTAPIDSPESCNRLPLVGVSSTGPGVRQTFVFAPPAIRRVLLDHDALFDRVIDLASPMPGRAIVIGEKKGLT